MPVIRSAAKKLVSALFGASWGRRVLTGLILAAVVGAAAVVLLQRNSPSQTTYSNQDGAYKVTVTHFPDGSKQEVREGNVARGAP
jgi:hypothetical protein